MISAFPRCPDKIRRRLRALFKYGIPTLALVLAAPLSAQVPRGNETRGERVGWARLKTPSKAWFRHAKGDPSLMLFLQENTTLNIDPTWHVADVKSIAEMSQYPLLFSQGVHMIDDPVSRANLAEYIRRGGFLLIDACINRGITPDPNLFLEQQQKFLKEILPEARVIALPRDHPVYSTYFKIPGGLPPHTYHDNIFNEEWHKHGLYGVFIDSHLAGLVSLSGLQCGWDHMPGPKDHNVACMRMLVNIYVYAILQAN